MKSMHSRNENPDTLPRGFLPYILMILMIGLPLIIIFYFIAAHSHSVSIG